MRATNSTRIHYCVACSRHWHRLLGHLFSNVLINHFNSITSKIVVFVVVVVSMMFSSFFRVYSCVCHKKITHQHTESRLYRYICSPSVRRFVRRYVSSLVSTHSERGGRELEKGYRRNKNENERRVNYCW